MTSEHEVTADMSHSSGHGTSPKLGAGKSPVVLVVDFIEGFTNEEVRLAGSWADEIEVTSRLIEAARERNVPIIFTTVEFCPSEIGRNLLTLKTPDVGILLKGTKWTEIDHRLEVNSQDLVISKKFASSFFGTSLVSHLQVLGVDTILLAGCVTSGCVRASAVDAVQYGFRPIVISDAVGDRSQTVHDGALRDVAQLYGDVETSTYVFNYFETLGEAS